MPRFRLQKKSTKALRARMLAERVCALHAILAAPNTKSEDVKKAKRQMLQALMEMKKHPAPQMIVPPMRPPEEEDEIAGLQELDENLLSEMCKARQ